MTMLLVQQLRLIVDHYSRVTSPSCTRWHISFEVLPHDVAIYCITLNSSACLNKRAPLNFVVLQASFISEMYLVPGQINSFHMLR